MAKKRTPNKGRSNSTQYDDVVSRIQDVTEVENFLSVLGYGRSGTGKTTALVHILPKPLLVIDINEKGTDSVVDVEGVKVFKPKSWEDVESMYWYLESGNHPYKSVLIDTVTQLQELSQKFILEDEGKDFLSLQLRGKASELMKTWLMSYRDLPMHVGFTAQDRVSETDTEEEDQIMPEVGPAVSPGIAKTLNAMVKLILHTYIQEVITRKDGKIERKMEYRIRTGPHQYYLTKVKKPKKAPVPDYIMDPTFEDIISLMNGTYDPNKKRKPLVSSTNKKPKRPIKK